MDDVSLTFEVATVRVGGRRIDLGAVVERLEQEPARDPTVRAASDGKLAYSVSEAARLISVGRSTIYQLIDRGELATIQIGRRRLVPRDALNELVVSARVVR